VLVNNVDEFEKFTKKAERKFEMVVLKKVRKQLISRFQHELKKMLISNTHENEMRGLEMLQMEICISKFVLFQIKNIIVNEMICM
jgi:hypothetical protein